jgi:hypothetical protein
MKALLRFLCHRKNLGSCGGIDEEQSLLKPYASSAGTPDVSKDLFGGSFTNRQGVKSQKTWLFFYVVTVVIAPSYLGLKSYFFI